MNIEILEHRIAPAAFVNATTVTYTDVDGDEVTIKITKGAFDLALTAFTFAEITPGREQLQKLDLSDPAFAGTNITITAKRSVTNGGDGFVNVGFIDARDGVNNIDLGAVSIDGDLGSLEAGDGDDVGAALKSLTVQSLGALGLSTQGGAGNLNIIATGSIGTLSVKGDVLSQVEASGAASARIGAVSIGGTLQGGSESQSGALVTTGEMGSIKVGGSILGGSGTLSGIISANGTITSVTIGGSVEGGTDTGAGQIIGRAGIGAIKIGVDLRGGTAAETGRISSDLGTIKSLTIGGSVLGGSGDFLEHNAQIFAGTTLGPVTITGDLRGGSGINDAVLRGDVVASVKVGSSLIAGSDQGSGGIFADAGNIGTVTIGGSFEAGSSFDTGRMVASGAIGSVKIGGSWLRVNSGDSTIQAQAGDIGSVTVGGDLRSSGGTSAILTGGGGNIGAVTVNGSVLGGAVSALVSADGALKSLTVKGSIIGNSSFDVLFRAAAAGTPLLTIGKVTVNGKVEYASFHGTDADGVMGPITIGGDFISSRIAVGTDDGADNLPGTADDTFLGGGDLTKLATLTSLTVKGMAYGTPSEIEDGDSFRVLAEKLGKISIGGTTAPLTAGVDFLALSPTFDLFAGEEIESVSDFLVINEVMFNPPGADQPNEYIELRGQPGTVIADGTYLVLIGGSGGVNLGEVRQIFDLSGVQLGGAGFLVLAQDGHTYTIDPDATVLESTGTGFDGLPGFSFDAGLESLPDASFSLLLVQSTSGPALTHDIDANDDGAADGIVFGGWTVVDSIGQLDGSANGDASYADVTFRHNTGNGTAAGTVIDIAFTPEYLARAGNSTGFDASDWLASAGLAGAAPNFTLGALAANVFNAPPGAAINHLGAANFIAPIVISATKFTYQDVDGDLVTVQISKGPLDPGTLATFAPRGLGLQLQELDLTQTPALFDKSNLSITAKRGVDGGDGFANVGFILARNTAGTAATDLGTVVVDGDLGRIQVGDGTDLSLKSLTAQSLGAFGLTTQEAGADLGSLAFKGAGTLNIKGDIRESRFEAGGAFTSVTIGGSIIGGANSLSGFLHASGPGKNGAIKIGGSILGGSGSSSGRLLLNGNATSITVGGSVVGGTNDTTGSIIVMGDLSSLKIGGDVRGGASAGVALSGHIGSTGTIGSLFIGGSVLGSDSDFNGAGYMGQIHAITGFGTVTIGGSIIGRGGDYSGQLHGDGIASLKVGGSIIGGNGAESGTIQSTMADVGTITIGGSIIGGIASSTGGIFAGNLKSLTLGGSFVSSVGSGTIFVNQVLTTLLIKGNLDARLADGGAGIHALEIKNVTVNGWVLGSLAASPTVLSAADGFGSLTVKGSIVGASAANPLEIVGVETAISGATVGFGKITVGGKVQNTTFVAGGGQNGDAQIGAISIGGDFIASRIAAGTSEEGDGLFGTADDNFIGGGSALLSKIASVTIKGMAYGTPGGTDEFRILAQTIGKITVGGIVIPITPGIGDIPIGPTNDLFARDAS